MNRQAFTLVELMVAIAVFVGVVMIATMAVNEFSRAGREADQSLVLHSRHAAIARDLDNSLGRAAGFAALYLKQDENGGELVWMNGTGERVYTRDLRLLYLRSSADQFNYYHRDFAKPQLLWGSLAWGDGELRLGESMRQHFHDDRDAGRDTYFHHTRPTPQEKIAFLLGSPSAGPSPGQAARIGPLCASFADKLSTLKELGKYPDSDGDGERRDEYDDWFYKVRDFAFFGTVNPEPQTYAVLNPDGRGVNKDWMYLAGTEDPDDHYYDQRLPIDKGIEFIEVTAYDRRGAQLSTELDSMSDGPDSMDWRGVPRYGLLDLSDWDDAAAAYKPFDLDQRPARLQMRWVLHAIPMQQLDEIDLDDDGDDQESLASAIRAVVLADASLLSIGERQQAFRELVRENGYAAEIFTHVVELEL